jgi:hypothetical protein
MLPQVRLTYAVGRRVLWRHACHNPSTNLCQVVEGRLCLRERLSHQGEC